MTLRIPGALILLTALSGAVSVAVAALPVVARFSAADQAWTAATQADTTGATDALGTPRVDLSPILDFAPFGRAATPQTAAVASDTTLILQGLSVSADPAASRAIIAGGIGDSSSYRVGQGVAPGMTLTAIAADHVTLTTDNGAQRLDFPNAPIQTATSETEGPGFSAKLQNLIPQSKPTLPTLSSLREQLQIDPEGLLSEYDITGDMGGYLIGSDTPVTETGLQPGDLITQINGQPVGDILSDSAFLDEVAATGQATVVVARAGQTLNLQVILP